LPSGLTFDTGTLTVSGTPAENGGFRPIFLVTDANGQTLRVTPCLLHQRRYETITISSNAAASHPIATGSPYSNQLSACCEASPSGRSSAARCRRTFCRRADC
jgi:hypothetical protein